MLSDLSNPEKVLLAASTLQNGLCGDKPFADEDLVVQAWMDDQKAFGLKGHSELFPDANRVRCCVMGKKGLRGRGLLAKVGTGLYSLTQAGREAVAEIGKRGRT